MNHGLKNKNNRLNTQNVNGWNLWPEVVARYTASLGLYSDFTRDVSMHIMHSSIIVSFTHLEESNVPTKTLFFFTKNSEHCSLLSISERDNDLLDASQSTDIV